MFYRCFSSTKQRPDFKYGLGGGQTDKKFPIRNVWTSLGAKMKRIRRLSPLLRIRFGSTVSDKKWSFSLGFGGDLIEVHHIRDSRKPLRASRTILKTSQKNYDFFFHVCNIHSIHLMKSSELATRSPRSDGPNPRNPSWTEIDLQRVYILSIQSVTISKKHRKSMDFQWSIFVEKFIF